MPSPRGGEGLAQSGMWNATFNGTATTAANLLQVRSEFWTVGMRNPWRMSSDPDGGSSFLSPQIAPPGPNVSVSFTLPANRSFQIETSTDMTTWNLWDVSKNNGIPHPGGPITLTGPQLGPNQFFRLNLREN